MPMGFSYQPGQTDAPGQQGQAGPRGLSPQEAVKLLSLRMPKTAPNAISPLPLLTAAGGGGSDLDMLIAALAGLMGSGRQLVGAGGPGSVGGIGAGVRQAGQTFAPGPQIPRIRPGQEVPGSDPSFVPGPPQGDTGFNRQDMGVGTKNPAQMPAPMGTPGFTSYPHQLPQTMTTGMKPLF